MKFDVNEPMMTRSERIKLHYLCHKRAKAVRKEKNPPGKVAGINRIPNGPEIDKFLEEINRKRQNGTT